MRKVVGRGCVSVGWCERFQEAIFPYAPPSHPDTVLCSSILAPKGQNKLEEHEAALSFEMFLSLCFSLRRILWNKGHLVLVTMATGCVDKKGRLVTPGKQVQLLQSRGPSGLWVMVYTADPPTWWNLWMAHPLMEALEQWPLGRCKGTERELHMTFGFYPAVTFMYKYANTAMPVYFLLPALPPPSWKDCQIIPITATSSRKIKQINAFLGKES